MSAVVGLASTLRRLPGDPGLQLMRAVLMPVVVAVLHHHLGGSRSPSPTGQGSAT